MITGIEGILGSGKSYEAVAFHVLPALKAGRKVITNLPLDLQALGAIDPDYADLIEIKHAPSPVLGKWDASNIADHPAFQPFTDGHTKKQPDSVSTFGTVWDYHDNWRGSDGRGPVFVIDECHVPLPKSGTSSEVVEWFKLHRHYNSDVVLLTQSFRDINQPIAGLIANLVKCRKADILGQSDHYIRKVHGGYRGAVIQTDKRAYKAQYFGLYKSHTQGLSIEEAKAQDVSPFIVKFNRFKWVFLAFTAVFVTWAFWPRGSNVFGVKSGVFDKSHIASSSLPSALVSRPAAAGHRQDTPAVPDKPAKSDFGVLSDVKVSITGMIASARASVAVFVVSDGSRRMFDVTSDELERAGYTFEPFGYCLGWLQYKGERRPVVCDAPAMDTGTQDKPIAFDSGTGRWSNETGQIRPPPVSAQAFVN